jgi:hypothetical protein
MATITWIGGNSGDIWSDADNWDSGVPGSGDDVVFGADADYESVVDSSFAGTINSLTTSSYEYTLTLERDLTITDDLIIGGSSAINASSGEKIYVGDDYTVGDASYGGSVTIVLNGTGNQAITVTNAGVCVSPSIEIDKASGDVSVSDVLTISTDGGTTLGDLTITDTGTGEFGGSDVNCQNFTLTAGIVTNDIYTYGDVTGDSGTMTGVLYFEGATQNWTPGDTEWSDVNIDSNAGVDLLGDATTTTFTHNGNYIGGSYNVNVSGDYTFNSTLGGTATVKLNGTGNQYITYGGTGGTYSPNLEIDKASGDVSASNYVVLSMDGGTTYGDFTITDTGTGVFDLNADYFCGDLTITAGEIYNDGSGDIIYAYGDVTGDSGELAATAGVTFRGNSVSNWTPGNVQWGRIDIASELGGGGAQIMSGTADINGDLLISSDTLDANDCDINISGDWDNEVGNTGFDAGTGEVTFDGSAQSISGDTTFYDLKMATDDQVISFEAGSTTTIEGTWTVGGSGATDEVILQQDGSSGGDRWTVDYQGDTSSITYVKVQDSEADPAIIVTDWASKDNGNNTGWSSSAESSSPSASSSVSESVSPSISPSASESVSPSVSASLSPSSSYSPSTSISVSPSLSASASESVSQSVSPSMSPSLPPVELTDYLDPNSDVAQGWNRSAGSDNFELIDDGLDSDIRQPDAATTTDYIYTVGGSSIVDEYTLTNIDLKSGDLITLKIWIYVQKNAGNDVAVQASYYDGVAWSEYLDFNEGDTWAWKSVEWANLSLNQTQVNDLKIRLRCSYTGGEIGQYQVAELYAEVIYSSTLAADYWNVRKTLSSESASPSISPSYSESTSPSASPSASRSPSASPSAGTSGIIDMYDEINQNTFINIYDRTIVGQSFTGDGQTLDTVSFYLYKMGSPTGNCYARISGHSGTYGTSSISTGVILATSNPRVTNEITSSYSYFTFTFPEEEKIILESGVNYCVEMFYEYADGLNRPTLGIDDSSPTHSGNAFRYYPAGLEFIPIANQDLIFRITGTTTSPSMSPSTSPSISESISPSVSESGSPSISQSISTSISPSLSESISESASISPSSSESISASISESASLSESVSESLSPSISESVSPSLSPSVSQSASYSQSISESRSPSISESISESISLSMSESASISQSVSESRSASVSESISESLSESISPSLSESISESASYSESVSESVSSSISESISESESPSEGVSESASYSPSISESKSPSISASRSISVSPSISASISQSISQSVSQSVSPSASISQSVSASVSQSTSPSRSISISQSISSSASESISASISESVSASVSPSISESISASLSESGSASISPSRSASVSSSVSVSLSPSASISPSISTSASPSASYSPSTSESASPSLSESIAEEEVGGYIPKIVKKKQQNIYVKLKNNCYLNLTTQEFVVALSSDKTFIPFEPKMVDNFDFRMKDLLIQFSDNETAVLLLER